MNRSPSSIAERRVRKEVLIEVTNTNSQGKSDNCKQKVVAWTSRNRLVLFLASIFVPLAYLLGAASIRRASASTTLVLLFAFLVFACAVLTVAVAWIIEVLNGIKTELVMIRSGVDTERLEDIATDVTAIRNQMGKGVLGLLGP